MVRPFLHLLINCYDTSHQNIYVSWMCMHHSCKKSFSKSVTPKGRLSPFIWGKKGVYNPSHFLLCLLSSVQFILSGVSDSLRRHGLQHPRPPTPSPTPGAYSNSRSLSRWCHPTNSPSAVPSFSCLQSYPHQGLFKWVRSLYQVAKVLEFQLQRQSF